MVNVDRSSDIPLYRQVYESLRRDIVAGVWGPGERIPSIRALMGDLGVSRNTVANACQQLYAEGYVESRRGSGYYVSDISFDMLRRPDGPDAGRADDGGEDEGEGEPDRWLCDFSYGNLRPELFPLGTWRKLSAEVLTTENARRISSYSAPAGDRGLRREIARYLERSRGVACTASRIVLTSGIQQSIERLLGLFDPAEDGFAMENPGFYRVRRIAYDRGFNVVVFPSDAMDSIWLRVLSKSSFKLIYATPSNQMPMGSYQPLETRMQLLKLALERDAFIIEDDYDSIFRHSTLPLPTLSSLDQWGRVVYMGTFSKVLSPALRMGYLALPEQLAERYARRYEDYRCTVSWTEQETMRLFMERGHFERHVRRVERDIRVRHAALTDALRAYMPERVDVIGGESGLHLLLRVRNGWSQEKLVQAAAEAGVRIMTTRQYWNDPARAPKDLVMLGYSGAGPQDVEQGVKLLAQAWFDR